jgi:hypothetical protein
MENLYKLFADNDLTTSQYNWSEKWLGKSKTYASTIRAQKRDLSLPAMLNLLKNVEAYLANNIPVEKRVMLEGVQTHLRRKIFG